MTAATDTALYNSPALVEVGPYIVRELSLTWEKANQIWETVSKFRTLFSDLTRGDISNFLRFITSTDSLWLEIYEGPRFMGIVCFTNLYKVVDTDAHIIFFDRELADKVELCQGITRWVFDELPLQRVSVDIPTIYHRTIRLVKNIGFRFEGERRRAVLIGGRWINVLQFGIIREEVVR